MKFQGAKRQSQLKRNNKNIQKQSRIHTCWTKNGIPPGRNKVNGKQHVKIQYVVHIKNMLYNNLLIQNQTTLAFGSFFLRPLRSGNDHMGPTKREVRKIIDSKVPAGKGYVSFQEGIDPRVVQGLVTTRRFFFSGGAHVIYIHHTLSFWTFDIKDLKRHLSNMQM